MTDDIVNLGEASQYPSTQRPAEGLCEYGVDSVETCPAAVMEPANSRGSGRPRRASNAGRSSSAPSQPADEPPHKVRGPNWTEAEMLVLIAQKRIEWDGRHTCNQPSLAKFVYGSTAWKLVLAGCMAVPGFRARDADQITNKWDGLIKEYKKLKDYIEGSGSANWWGLCRDEKRELSRTRKMPLEFSEFMYSEMETFVGKRQIFGRSTEAVDSDRPAAPARRTFARGSPAAVDPGRADAGSPATNATTTPTSAAQGTPGDDTPGSTCRKRKSSGTDNLVDFVKDFNFDYIAHIEAQDQDKRVWRTDVMAFDIAREARIAKKDAENLILEQKLYELEAERTRNLGNMTSALLMMASSMDALTRYTNRTLHC
jgi:hypothetical protein